MRPSFDAHTHAPVSKRPREANKDVIKAGFLLEAARALQLEAWDWCQGRLGPKMPLKNTAQLLEIHLDDFSVRVGIYGALKKETNRETTHEKNSEDLLKSV